ncbi:transposase [Streptomyces mirabilis]|uniref:transposase n=1 Tax=Streptomyces mirabilis TaxID=68239 RepID=UPI0036D8928E
MSLQPRDYQRIPARTVRTAWSACPKGTPAMLVRDRLDVLFEDEEFADLYPSDGRPVFSPGQLALVSVLQFAEDLSDRAAAQAVRTRIDWKYALVRHEAPLFRAGMEGPRRWPVAAGQ